MRKKILLHLNFKLRDLFFNGLIFLGAVFFSNSSFAYPDMIAHGYSSCRACHASNHGGDLLTDYGKSLSSELLSQKKWPWMKTEALESEPQTVPEIQWTWGTHLRLLQTHVQNSKAQKGRFIIMQADLDVYYRNQGFGAYYSVGRYEPSQSQVTGTDFVYTPRGWLAYDLNEQWQIRAGRYFPTYGILLAEHTWVNRKNLGFYPGTENLLTEVTYESEDYFISLQQLMKKYSYVTSQDEKGYIFQIVKNIDKYRIGFNAYQSEAATAGSTSLKKNDFMGIFSVLTLSEDTTLLFQLDRIRNADGTNGFLDLIKYSRTYFQGLNLFITQEYYNPKTENSDPRQEAYGIGTQYYPYQGIDIETVYRKEKNSGVLNEFQDVLWIILHAYY